MARKKKKEQELSPKTPEVDAQAKQNPDGDFDLNPDFYEQSDAFEVYASERKITKVFGLKDKGTEGEPYLKARTRSKTPRGWRFSYGVDLHTSTHLTRFIQGVLKLAKKIGWQLRPGQDIEKIKDKLRDSEETIIRLEKTNKDLREEHEELMIAFRKHQEAILHSRVDEFDSDVEKLREILADALSKKVSEQDLQDFLYEHPWLFGTEYINAEPQKLRGAHSKFDFYLERFNKTNDIVEIKLASEAIINKDGSIAAKVTQAVDQLIDYMESSQAAAHSTVIADEEGIRELRPRGIVIIGSDSSKDAKRKLHKWNYQFGHISILTYQDVLERAVGVLQHLRSEKKST